MSGPEYLIRKLTIARRWSCFAAARRAALAGRSAARHAVLGRMAWALLLAIHLPALLKSWRGCWRLLFGTDAGGPSDWQLAGAIWLTAAVAFFVLKIWGVPWLRFRTSPRCLVVAALAVLLMHGGALGLPDHTVAIPGDAPLVTSLLLLFGLERVQEFLCAATAAACGAAEPRALRWRCAALITTPLHARLAVLVRAPRAPPANR